MLMFSVATGATIRLLVLRLTTDVSVSSQSLRFPSVFQSSFPDRMISPNKVTTLDAAMTILFHAERQWRGASEFFR